MHTLTNFPPTLLHTPPCSRLALAYWQLLLLAAMTCSGNSWIDSVILVTNVRNLPQHRGTVVGIMKSCIGLSASVYTALYLGLYAPRSTDFLLFLAGAPTVLALACGPFVGHVPYIQHSELKRRGRRTFTTERRFAFTLCALGALAVYLGATALLSAHVGPAVHAAFAGGVLLLLAPLGVLPVRSGGLFSRPWEPHDRDAAAEAGDLARPLLGGDAAAAKAPGSVAGRETSQTPTPSSPPPATHPPPRQVVIHSSTELPPLSMLRHPNFPLLFIPCFFGMGVGLVFINNAAQLVQALGGAAGGQAPLLVLFSVCNWAGRVSTGWVSERRLHADGTPRPVFLVAFTAATSLVCAGFALSGRALLPVLSSAAGFCFGGTWTLMSTLVSELFGMKHFASNYCTFQLAPGLGSYALATKLAGGLYARAMAASGQTGTVCYGRACFAYTWLTLAALGLLGTGCALALLRRTAPAYRAEYEELHALDAISDDDDDDEGDNAGQQRAG